MKYRVATPVVLDASKGRDKVTRWTQIGTAWSDEPEGKITVALSALPFRSEFIYLFPENSEDDRRDKGARFDESK